MANQPKQLDLLWEIKKLTDQEMETKVNFARMLKEKDYCDGILSVARTSSNPDLLILLDHYDDLGIYSLEQFESLIQDAELNEKIDSKRSELSKQELKKNVWISGLSLFSGLLIGIMILLGVVTYWLVSSDRLEQVLVSLVAKKDARSEVQVEEPVNQTTILSTSMMSSSSPKGEGLNEVEDFVVSSKGSEVISKPSDLIENNSTPLQAISVNSETSSAVDMDVASKRVQDELPIATPLEKVSTSSVEQTKSSVTSLDPQQQVIALVEQTIPSQEKIEQLITAKKVLRLHGSNTVGEALAPTLIEAFYKQQTGAEIKHVQGDAEVEGSLEISLPNQDAISIEVHAHGSSTAFKDLMKAETDMGMASRAIKPQEVVDLKPMYGDFSAQGSEFVIALDGLAVIVHPANPITSLSTDNVAKLFSGDISNWAQIGGQAGEVNVYARDGNSGTWDTFKNLVLKKHKKSLRGDAKRYESSTQLSDNVAGDINAIGFIGLPYVRSSKALAISDGENVSPVVPTSFTVSTEDYPLSRRLYFYVPQFLNSRNIAGSHQIMRDLARFTLSKQGQDIVKEVGFISQNIRLFQPDNSNRNLPLDYLSRTEGASRLSLNIRFALGADKFDTKAVYDLERLVDFMEDSPEQRLMLFGFTDDIGGDKTNKSLSYRRAKTVENALIARGVIPHFVAGYGEAAPVASNETEAGRNKNRRVEAWVQ